MAAFLNQLRRLSAKRHYRALEGLMSPTFRVEFDGRQGAGCVSSVLAQSRRNSRLWEILDRLLALAGRYYSESLFAVPYVYTRFPLSLDPLGAWLHLKADAQVIERPETGARPMVELNHSILGEKPLQTPVIIPSRSFLEVRHPEAGRCFVAANDV